MPGRHVGRAAAALVVGLACFLVLRRGVKGRCGAKDEESLYAPELSTLALPPSSDSPRSKQSTSSERRAHGRWAR